MGSGEIAHKQYCQSNSSTQLCVYSSCSSSSSLSSQQSLQSLPSLSLPNHVDQIFHHHCISTFKGHNSYVFSLLLSGKHLYSGSYNGEIRVWSCDQNDHQAPNYYDNNNIVANYNACGAAVKSLAVLGDHIFSAHQDRKIRVWKINSKTTKYKCVATLPTLNERFLRVFSTKNYVQVRRHKSCTWVHHVDTVSALALSRDGSHLYSASWDRTFKVWGTTNFRCLESVAKAHDDAINALIVSNDGHVYTGSADKTIKVWKKQRKHSLVATLEKHKSGVNALSLSSDESLLYSGASDRSIVVWERQSDGCGEKNFNMVVVGALRGHSRAILCLTVVSDLLCSGSADKTIRIWRRLSSGNIDHNKKSHNHACLAVLEGHLKPVKCLTATVDGNSSGSGSGSDSDSGTSYLVYSGSLDCDIKVWRVRVPI